MPFPYSGGGNSAGSSMVSERLITRLASIKGIQVIERSLLDKVMGEMKLESTGIIDTENTKKLGKVLGVEAIVSGTLIDLKDRETEVNARMINVETGEILSAATVKVERTWNAAFAARGNKPEMNRHEMPAGQKMEMPAEPEENITAQDGGDGELAAKAEAGRLPPFEMVERSQQYLKDGKYRAALVYAKSGFRLAQKPMVKGRALFIIGRAYEGLGAAERAKAAYRLILRNYNNQGEIVDRAQKRLKELDR